MISGETNRPEILKKLRANVHRGLNICAFGPRNAGKSLWVDVFVTSINGFGEAEEKKAANSDKKALYQLRSLRRTATKLLDRLQTAFKDQPQEDAAAPARLENTKKLIELKKQLNAAPDDGEVYASIETFLNTHNIDNQWEGVSLDDEATQLNKQFTTQLQKRPDREGVLRLFEGKKKGANNAVPCLIVDSPGEYCGEDNDSLSPILATCHVIVVFFSLDGLSPAYVGGNQDGNTISVMDRPMDLASKLLKKFPDCQAPLLCLNLTFGDKIGGFNDTADGTLHTNEFCSAALPREVWLARSVNCKDDATLQFADWLSKDVLPPAQDAHVQDNEQCVWNEIIRKIREGTNMYNFNQAVAWPGPLCVTVSGLVVNNGEEQPADGDEQYKRVGETCEHIYKQAVAYLAPVKKERNGRRCTRSFASAYVRHQENVSRIRSYFVAVSFVALIITSGALAWSVWNWWAR